MNSTINKKNYCANTKLTFLKKPPAYKVIFLSIGIFFYLSIPLNAHAFNETLRVPFVSQKQKGRISNTVLLYQSKELNRAMSFYKEAMTLHNEAQQKRDDGLDKQARFKITEAYKITMGILEYFKENETMSNQMALDMLSIARGFREINPLSESDRTSQIINVLETVVRNSKTIKFREAYQAIEPKIVLPARTIQKRVSYKYMGRTVEATWEGVPINVKDLKRIFIFPYSCGVGDIIKLNPLLKSIKRYLPGVQVACMVPNARSVLIDKDFVDEIITYGDELEARRDTNNLMKIAQVSRLYREGGFDASLIPFDVHRDRSIDLCNKLNIPYVITEGYPTDYIIKPTNTVRIDFKDKQTASYRYRHPDIDISHVFVALLLPIIQDAAYLEQADCIPNLPQPRGASADNAVENFYNQNKIKKDDFVILAAPSAASALRWPEGNFAALFDSLCSKNKVKIILLIGPTAEDQETAQKILGKITGPAKNKCYIFRSEDIAAFYQISTRANLFITNNSGPSHLFAAFNHFCPEVIIYENEHLRSRWQPKARNIFPVVAGEQGIRAISANVIINVLNGIIENPALMDEIKKYTDSYFREHGIIENYMFFSPAILMASLLDPNSIHLDFGKPKPFDTPHTDRKKLVMAARSYLDQLPHKIKVYLYENKIKSMGLGICIRDYLLEAIERERLGIVDTKDREAVISLLKASKDFFQTGGSLIDIQDMSSHRIWRQGDEVYRLTFLLGNIEVEIVLKLGAGVKHEEFYSKYLEIFGRQSPYIRAYNIKGESFVLMKYIRGEQFSKYTSFSDDIPFASADSYLYRLKDDILRKLAEEAALADAVGKADRQLGIFKADNGIYGNYLIQAGISSPTIYSLDHEFLLADRSHNRKWTRCGKSEISFIGLFVGMLDHEQLERMLSIYREAYLKQCELIKEKKKEIVGLTMEYLGEEQSGQIEQNIPNMSRYAEENIEDTRRFVQKLIYCRNYYALSSGDTRKARFQESIERILEGSSDFESQEQELFQAFGTHAVLDGLQDSRQTANYIGNLIDNEEPLSETLRNIAIRQYVREQETIAAANMQSIKSNNEKYDKDGKPVSFEGITIVSNLEESDNFTRLVQSIIGNRDDPVEDKEVFPGLSSINKWQKDSLGEKIIGTVRIGSEHVTLYDGVSKGDWVSKYAKQLNDETKVEIDREKTEILEKKRKILFENDKKVRNINLEADLEKAKEDAGEEATYIVIQRRIIEALRNFQSNKVPRFKPIGVAAFPPGVDDKAVLILNVAPVEAEDLAVVTKLQEVIRDATGIRNFGAFKGHITIGYFINPVAEDKLEELKQYIAKLDAYIKEHSDDYIFELPSIEVSRFSDMESFPTVENGSFSWRLQGNSLAQRISELLKFKRTIISTDDGNKFTVELHITPAKYLGRTWYRLSLKNRETGKEIGYADFRLDRREKRAYMDTSYGWAQFRDKDAPANDWATYKEAEWFNGSDNAIEIESKYREKYKGLGSSLLSLALGIAKQEGMEKFKIRDMIRYEGARLYKQFGFDNNYELDLINRNIPDFAILKKLRNEV